MRLGPCSLLGAPARAPPGLMTLINRGALGLTVPGTRRIAGAADYDDLLELAADRRFVLLGEASHGSHDFYQERARITQRLILEKGFTAVAVEADWPDAYRVNRYVMGAIGRS